MYTKKVITNLSLEHVCRITTTAQNLNFVFKTRSLKTIVE